MGVTFFMKRERDMVKDGERWREDDAKMASARAPETVGARSAGIRCRDTQDAGR